MTTFIRVKAGVVEIRLASPPGDIKADFMEQVYEGEVWQGYTYRELKALGSGQHELEERS